MSVRQEVRSMEKEWAAYAKTLAQPCAGFSRRVLIRVASLHTR